MSAEIKVWAAEALPGDVRLSLERLARQPGVVRVVVMPDVHLSHDVCIGTVLATEGVLYPAAIGGDIGCGMSTLRFHGEASQVADQAARVMDGIRQGVPILRHQKRRSLPDALAGPLECAPLESARRREGRLQFGTLGRGNHFVELQTDHDGALWLTVHTGSRSMGPCVQRLFAGDSPGLTALEAGTEDADAFLGAHDWAVEYARLSREEITAAVGAVLMRCFGFLPDLSTHIDCVHNRVRLEEHGGRRLWVHRKGAVSARWGEAGIIPGSMGDPTYLVTGRGCDAALHSSSHGAGRRMSRREARQRISLKKLRSQTRGVFINEPMEAQLVEEAPGAYKNISAVMRAQRELTRIVGELRPVLNYKGG